ncbi:lysophospholipid acyltransferase family protein [Litorihabitans aurantiacus]|uniref:1-acyl-sn-glycerol-3-phosphate acyltransferase n=1 Tax=Litorihabitans aurantiacus TaxID=1930061 RepID=A0AA37UHH0_9MICO|nr:lysophospholipid acyltransferase family protein [Litorihabitans aurantiacus]GMA30828.1 1-acyl-sn-glycerol-3-phosphate acyltransferase [Litorihabitans aurantiacus]
MNDTPANRSPRRYSLTYRGIAGVVKPLLALVSGKDWRGMERLPREGGVIVAANHVSLLDPVTTAHSLYDNGAPPRIMAKAELFRVPILGRLLRGSGQIPVHRNTRNAADSLEGARRALAAGECVLIFPEGTLTLDPDGWPMVARTGVARLALTSGAPVVPVAQWGASTLLPPRAKLPRLLPRTRMQVLVGEPVDLGDLVGRTDAAALTEATARIMGAITAQLVQLRGGEPPVTPFDRRAAGL